MANYEIPKSISQDRYVLEPGQTALVVMDSSKSIEDLTDAWNNRSSAPATSMMHMYITATDHLEDGVIDNTEVIVQTYPLEPVIGYAGGWRVRQPPIPQSAADAGVIGASVMDTKRRRKTPQPYQT